MAIIYGRSDSEKRLLSKYPKEVQKIQDIPLVYEKYKEKLQHRETGFFAFFKTWNKKRQLDKFRKNKHNPLHAGTKGENKVIEQLSTLNDNYHIFCGLQIWLPYTVRYHGFKNLRSAQLDFVIVSKKGVFVIEVKNWSDNYVRNYDGFQPHEQVDRAGRVLWITLQHRSIDVRVTNVLLSIHNNIRYDQNYKMVFVSSLEKINEFLESRYDMLSDDMVEKIIHDLKYYVTK